jgi:glycosyltransferase involved in cell wall biosynthesis
MKIALVHNLTRGGALRTVREHLPWLGTDVVEFCLSTASPATDAPQVTAYDVRAAQVSRHLRPPLRYADLATLTVAWMRVQRAVERFRPDVVLVHPCQFLQAPTMLRSDLPSLYFCHEPRRVDYEAAAIASRNDATRRLYGPLYAAERRLDRAAVERASALVTNSRFTAARIERAYGRLATVVPMGAGEIFRASAPREAADHLLTVGTLIPSKGHDLVLEATAATSRRRSVIVVAPRSAPDEERRLRGRAAQLGVHVDIRIGVSDEELCQLYAGAFATVFLSREEPLGLVSLEAQAAGCPIIVADDGGLPETIIDGATGVVVPRSAEAAARALDRLETAGVRETMGNAARVHGRTMSWQRSAEAVRQNLEALAGR